MSVNICLCSILTIFNTNSLYLFVNITSMDVKAEHRWSKWRGQFGWVADNATKWAPITAPRATSFVAGLVTGNSTRFLCGYLRLGVHLLVSKGSISWSIPRKRDNRAVATTERQSILVKLFSESFVERLSKNLLFFQVAILLCEFTTFTDHLDEVIFKNLCLLNISPRVGHVL